MIEYTLDYDELRRIYRLETKSPKLSKLDVSFYKELKKFITQEKTRYFSAIESLSQEELKKYDALKSMVSKIREIRLKKCLNLCLMYSRTKDFKEDNLIDFEVDFVKGVLKLMDRQQEYTDSLFGTKKTKVENSAPIIKATVLQNIPSFIAPDMKEYGPFEKEMICELPKNIFDMLHSKNFVKEYE
jgi:DNA replication initiation complex subunit (GINS family)